jgi:hypothetical protein
MNTDLRTNGTFATAKPRHQTVPVQEIIPWPDSSGLICVHRCSSVVSMESMRFELNADDV